MRSAETADFAEDFEGPPIEDRYPHAFRRYGIAAWKTYKRGGHMVWDCKYHFVWLNRSRNIKRFHDDMRDQLERHFADLLDAYNSAQRSKILSALTPYGA